MTIDYAHLLVRQRFVLCIITLLVGGFVAFGISKTVQDNSTEAILAQDDPYKEEIDQNKADFPSSPSILFAFEGKPDVFNVAALGAMEAFSERYLEIDSAVAVGSLLNYPLNDADSAAVGRRYLIPELQGLTTQALDEVRNLALADEDLTKRILAKDGSMALATVKYNLINALNGAYH